MGTGAQTWQLRPLTTSTGSKPFYPLVLDFIAGLYGWLALMSRGIGRMARDVRERETLKIELPEDLRAVPVNELATAADLPSVIQPLKLRSRVQASPLRSTLSRLQTRQCGNTAIWPTKRSRAPNGCSS